MLKIKIIAKYTTNLLGMVSTLILGLNAIDGITIPYCRQIIDVIVLLQGIIGAYLISGKLFSLKEGE